MPRQILDDRDLHKFATREFVQTELERILAEIEERLANIEVGGGSGDCVMYTGDYVITPRTTEQVMHTADKHMSDDVSIKKIPYFETSNLSGGDTVYIGTEVT